MATKNIKPKDDTTKMVMGYSPADEELKVFNQYKDRKRELLASRNSIHGINIDEKMREWDKNYFNRDASIPPSELDVDQKPIAINNAFGKVQSALGILIDRNPEITLEESNPKYTANRDLIKGLAKNSWRKTNSLGQLKLSIFNSAKRGWFCGRTYYRSLKHDARYLTAVAEKDGKKTYETKEMTKVDDVQYMNLDNFNVWLDEQTVPEDFFSTRDWMWREVHHIDDIRKMFPESEYPNMKYVKEGGDTRETIEGSFQSNSVEQSSSQAKEIKKGMTEIYYYENQYDDWFIVEINGVMVCWEPLPQDHKRLSCVYGYWNLRSAETIYGIGIVESMEANEALIDRIMNMDMRQLLLTISPPGFYTGTEDPEDENLKYKAGTLRRTLDPKNITFLEIPAGNQAGLDKIAWLENKEDARTGITRTLEGEQAQNSTTAFETGVNREAGLKRLRLPLKSIQYALEWEFRNRIDLIKQVYNDFQVEQSVDPEDIQNYLEEINADPDYYYIENEGVPNEEVFYKKKYRQVQMNVDQDEKGNFVETEDKKFFHIKPSMLAFEGDVIVDAQSILVQSEELEKADTLRLANILIPLLMQGDPKKIGRAIKQLLLAFNKDPRKWLPDDWVEALNSAGKISSVPGKGSEPKPGEPTTKTPVTDPATDPTQPGADPTQLPPGMQPVVPPSNLDGSGKIGLGQTLTQGFNS